MCSHVFCHASCVQLWDTWEGHTKHCKVCRDAVEGLKKARVAAWVVCAIAAVQSECAARNTYPTSRHMHAHACRQANRHTKLACICSCLLTHQVCVYVPACLLAVAVVTAASASAAAAAASAAPAAALPPLAGWLWAALAVAAAGVANVLAGLIGRFYKWPYSHQDNN